MNKKRSFIRCLPVSSIVVPPNITPLLPGSLLSVKKAHGSGLVPVITGILHCPEEHI